MGDERSHLAVEVIVFFISHVHSMLRLRAKKYARNINRIRMKGHDQTPTNSVLRTEQSIGLASHKVVLQHNN